MSQSFLLQASPLTEVLQGIGISSYELCKRIVDKATDLLSSASTAGCEFPHDVLLQYLQTLKASLKGVSKDDARSIASQTVHCIIVPYLRILSAECRFSTSKQQNVGLSLKALAELLAAVLVHEGTSGVRDEIISEACVSIVDSLCTQKSEDSGTMFHDSINVSPTESEFDAKLVIFLLYQVFGELGMKDLEQDTNCCSVLSALYKKLFTLLQHCDSSSAFLLVSTVLPLFITTTHLYRAEDVWHFIDSVRNGRITAECYEQDLILAILCCFSSIFIHYDESSPFASPFVPEVVTKCPVHDLRTSETFWSILQEGLSSSNPLHRKRCMYLLHQVLASVQDRHCGAIVSGNWVFWWSSQCEKELQSVWGDLVLLLETLEEKQVHIVKPVRSRLSNVISASSNYVEGHSLLHISWLMVALSRVFVHETKSTIKWGVHECLDMPLKSSPLLEQEHWKFIFGPLLGVLNESLVYAREQHQYTPHDACPPVTRGLAGFLLRFISELPPEKKGLFLTQFICACASHKLGETPLVYISYAISQLPSMPLLSSEALAAIRSVVLTCLLTHKTSLRAAIQCFMLTAASKLTDMASVSYADVIMTLGSLKANECLTFGSNAWKQACNWVTRLSIEKGSKQEPSTTAVKHSSFLEYLQAAVQVSVRGKGGSSQDAPLSSTHLARITLLAIDAESINSAKLLSSGERSLEESVTLLLAPVLDIIAGARTHVYMSPSVVHNAVEFLVSMLELFLGGKAKKQPWEGSESCTGALLYKCLQPWLQDVVIYTQEELLCGSKEGKSPSLEHAVFYLNAVDHVYHFMQLFGFPFHSTPDIGPSYIARKSTTKLSASCSKKDVELTPAFLGAVTALSWVCSLSEDEGYPSKEEDSQKHPRIDTAFVVEVISKLPANIRVTKPLFSPRLVQGGPESYDSDVFTNPIDWGPLVSHCFTSYWQCILFTLKQLHSQKAVPSPEGSSEVKSLCEPGVAVLVGSKDVATLVQVFLDSLDQAGEEIASVIESLALLVPKLLKADSAFLVTAIETTWPLVLELKEKHKPFWRAIEKFLGIVFHSFLLCSPEPSVTEIQQKFASELYELGEARTGIYNLLIKHVCSIWLQCFKSRPAVVAASLRAHKELIMEACLFGPVYKKNLRIVQDVEFFVESLGESCSSNSLKFRYLEDDNSVRVCILSFLVEVAQAGCVQKPSGVASQSILQGFIPEFVESLLLKVHEISAQKPKYYINSLTHRRKLRLLQTLMLMLPWLDKPTAYVAAEQLLQALQYDNQLSVRYLMEWAVIQILTKHPHLLESLFYPSLQFDQKKRLGRMCSIFTIALHVGSGMKTAEEKVAYYLQAFPAVFQWCTSHHYVVRIYSQWAVFSIWDDCTRCDLKEVLCQFAVLGTGLISFMKQNSDAAKFSRKLEENFFLTKVKPGSDMSIETIFHILPLLCHVIDEEWITVDTFMASSTVWQDDLPFHVLCESKDLLLAVREAEAAPLEASGMDTRTISHQLKSEDGTSASDVQKKITPWSSTTGVLNELFPEHLPSFLHSTRRCQSGLVLVACLLHKAPNLGGLCRTCEIFGVSELVLSNMKLLEEKQFQSLSVTAEKWLTVTEVKLSVLREYLVNMRRKGYALVGVEQTAQSKCVTQYKFKHQTVLILGNEREGIPVEIIHLLDDCVEIPQFGIIRSLNVHVSGALLVWEYTKQHLMPPDAI